MRFLRTKDEVTWTWHMANTWGTGPLTASLWIPSASLASPPPATLLTQHFIPRPAVKGFLPRSKFSFCIQF